MAKRKRRKFTTEFKAEAVRLCAHGTRTVPDVSRELDLSEGSLRHWIAQSTVDAGGGPPDALTTAEREEPTRLRHDNRRLLMERENFKSSGHLLREGERVKFEFIASKQVVFPVRAMRTMLDVSRSGFYAHQKRRVSARTLDGARLTLEIRAAHRASRGTYGSPRVHRELVARGKRIGRKRVERLMRTDRLAGLPKKRFMATTDSKHGDPIAPDLLRRNFTTYAPNVPWVGDVTCVWTGQGWLFVAVLLDLFSRRVVGLATSEKNDTLLALAAFDRAIAARQPWRGLVHHTDRGSPYASNDYRAALACRGAVASMSRTGDCWDNSVAESFFSTLKTECTNRRWFPSRSLASASVADYIDHFYNPTRRHSTLDYVSPIAFELRQLTAFAA